MANSTASKNKTAAKAPAEKAKAEGAPVQTERAAKPIVPKKVDQNQTVIVRNGFQGPLTYISPRTKEKFHWDGFGSEQEMELKELRSAKNSFKKFFAYNWFMFDEDWIVEWLGVKQYYANAVNIDDFDATLVLPADELEEALSGISVGQKRSMAYRAKQLIENGEIDSNKAIRVLEEALGTELVER